MDVLYEFSGRCNLRCKHCYIWRQGKNKEKELPLDKKIAAMKKLSQKFDTIILLGGEPFIHSEFPTILDAASDLFKRVSVQTNGVVIDDCIKNYDNVSVTVSLEGKPSFNDAIRGYKVFENAVKNMIRMRKWGIPLTVRQTAMGENSPDYLLDLAEELDANYVAIAWKGSKDSQLTPDQDKLVEFYTKVNKARKQENDRNILVFDTPFYFLNKQLLSKYKSVFEKRGISCSSCTHRLDVKPNGDVAPCNIIDEKLGNIMEDGLDELMEKAQKFKQSIEEESLNETCKNCRFSSLCNGACMFFSHKEGFYDKKIRGYYNCPIPKIYKEKPEVI